MPQGHAELIQLVRDVQKSSLRGRSLWHSFCDSQGFKFRDPGLHAAETLTLFLESTDFGNDTEGQAAAPPRPVAREDVEAAKARAEQGLSELQVWQSLPTRWHPIFEKPLRLSYNIQRFDFEGLVRRILECPDGVPLCDLHKVSRPASFSPCPALRLGMVLAGVDLPQDQGRRSLNQERKDWKAQKDKEALETLYLRFLEEELLPQLAEEAGEEALEAVVQWTPVLRVMMPCERVATKPHRDADYGHIPEELNFWMPLVPVSGTGSLFAESFPGKGDFAPFEGEVGHVFRWWGSRCWHYAEPNSTGLTRISLDFRVVPRRLWDAAEAADLPMQAQRSRRLWHGGDMRVGSYYREASARRDVPS